MQLKKINFHVFKYCLFAIFCLLLPVQESTAQGNVQIAQSNTTFRNFDFNYGMKSWRQYGFSSIPDKIYDLLDDENYQRAMFLLRGKMNTSDGRLNPEAWFLSARVSMNQHDFTRALRMAQRVIGKYSDSADLYAVMSMSYLYARNTYDYPLLYAEKLNGICNGCSLYKYVKKVIKMHQSVQ